MKKIADYCLIVILSLLFFPVGVMAQVEGTPPEGFTYQAEARDRDGNAIANTKLSAQIILFQDEINGKIVYRENHKVTTDDFGMFTLVIGNGTSKNNFANIKWGAHSHFMNVKIKRLGDQRAINMGTIQLLSVPYALHAKTAGRVISLGADPQIKALKARINQLEESALSGTFTDSRDGKEYKSVRIGYQVWMAENLAYSDDSIHGFVYADNFDLFQYDPSLRYTINDSSLVDKEDFLDTYGYLYDYETITRSWQIGRDRNDEICPYGWHLPSKDEWNDLLGFISGSGYLDDQDLKAKNGWLTGTGDNNRFTDTEDFDHNGTNKLGFTALPGGFHYDSYREISFTGCWWCSTIITIPNPHDGGEEIDTYSGFYLTRDDPFRELPALGNKEMFRLSVRCVKD